MESREISVKCSQQMLNEGKDLEFILGFLRKSGCSKTQSIILLKEIKEISLDESKQLVHFSQEWQDTNKFDEEIFDDFYRVLIENDRDSRDFNG